MKQHCLAASLLLLSTSVLLAGGRPGPSRTPMPSSRPPQPGLNLYNPFPNITVPSLPNVSIPTPRLPSLPNVNNLPNFNFNPGPPSVYTFGDPPIPKHPVKINPPGEITAGMSNGQALGTSAPGVATGQNKGNQPSVSGVNAFNPNAGQGPTGQMNAGMGPVVGAGGSGTAAGPQSNSTVQNTTTSKPWTPSPGAAKGPPAPKDKGHSHAGIWHHHKWYWVVDTDSGGGSWQDVGEAAPADTAQALDDPTASDGAQAASGTPQTRRYFCIHNATGTKLTIHVAYQTLNQRDEWVWSEVLSYDYDPDEESAISDGGWKVNAVRARIWAEGEDGRQWYSCKDKDYWLVPETDDDGNHVYYAPQMATNTLTFN